MNDTVKQYIQKTAEFITKHAPFITSRYQNNRQAYNEIGMGLAALFAALCISLLPYDSIGLKEVIELYIKIVGGSAVLLAAYFGWKRLEVNQEGQITERFTRAIDQLGSEKLEIKLGGIYALERIAKDSPKDYQTIMEVLATYARENSQGLQSPDSRNLTADLQAVLTVLARRVAPSNTEDLQIIDLNNINIPLAQLRGANFNGCNLAGADLRGCNLENANLSECNLEDANLESANLIYANMREANLTNSSLGRACMRGASLDSATLSGADLTEALLEFASLLSVQANRANFKGAKLGETALNGSNFKVGSLWSLGTEDFDESAKQLSKEQIESATIDRETKLPDYLMTDPAWYEEQIRRSGEWHTEDLEGIQKP